MRIYHRSNFAVGICFLCLGVFSTLRGVSTRYGFDILMGVLYGGVGVAYIRISMNKERAARDQEASERSSQAARRWFGKLALPIHFLGCGLSVPGLILILTSHPPVGRFADPGGVYLYAFHRAKAETVGGMGHI